MMMMPTVADEAPFQLGESIPALLAEEWMVQPWTILPTFFEVFLVHQAQSALATTAESSVRLLRDKIRAWHIRWRQIMDNSNDEHGLPSAATTTTAASRASWSLQRRRLYQSLCATGSITLHVLETALTKYGREILFILRFCLERQSLRMTCATLSEHVYGLRRSTVDRTTGQVRSTKLDGRAERRLALLSALLPYLVSRVKDCVPPPGPKNRTRRKLLLLAKGCLMAQHLVDVAFLYAYMIGSTHYTGWINYWLRHVVRRVTQAELSSSSSSSSSTTAPVDPSAATTARVLLLSAAALSYAVQCVSWYRQSFPTIPAPPPKRFGDRLPPPGCPICLDLSPIDPTVVPTTGLVYCGRCIARHLRIHRVCPVTKLPIQHLQRLYEPE
jgi:hypothetical protein